MITSLLFFVFNVIDMKNWTNSLSRFSFHYRIQIFLLNVNAENGGCNAENLFKAQEKIAFRNFCIVYVDSFTSNLSSLSLSLKWDRSDVPGKEAKICNVTLNLPKFSQEHSEVNNQLFFIESYGKSSFRGRQLCSIESALRFSNYNVKVILLSSTLELRNPVICRHVNEFYPQKLQFYTKAKEELLKGLPVEGIIQRLDWNASQVKRTRSQIIDLMRYSLLYKYGGFFLDLDVLVLRDLRRYRNSIGMEAYR